jgi:hypothetical protein
MHCRGAFQERAQMPHYYFNVECEDFRTTDLVGEDCSSLEAVRREALNTAREIIVDDLLSGRLPHAGWIEVEDEDQRAVLVLPIAAAAS